MERVQTKIGAIMLIFLLLTVATAILVQRQGQGADATAINVAGRQRMLSQKMAKEALGIVHGDRPIQAQEQLRQTRDLFERGLSGLIEGDRDLGLGQEQDPAILQRLRQVQTMWEPMRQRVDRLVASDRAASLTDEAAYIYDHMITA
ncbi:MAG: hypothetical protein GX030_09450 [Firmicutes bacterium]|nr:hypothetical protein [Bacillota bacterium]